MTEGSSTSARQTLYALGPRYVIDVIDPSRLGQCRFSCYVRRWYRCPSYSRAPEAYLDFLVDRLRRGRYDVLFPTHEQVFLLSRFRDELSRLAGLALPSFESLERLMSKVRFIDLLEELGLPHPATTIVRGRGDLLRWDQYPCFVKVDHTTAGEGVRRLDDAAQLRKAADELDRAGWFESQAAVLVQRLAPGVRRVLTAVFQHGRLVGAHCDQTLAFGVGGSSRARVSIADRQAVDHMASLGAHLGWHGALCVEYFFEPAAERREYIECNPRIGETVNALLSGVNLCEQLVRVSLDETVAPLPDSRTGVRSHQRFLALAAMALEGQGRRQMLGELWRSLRRRGWYEDSQDELTRPRDDWLSLIPYLGVTSVLLARPGAARGLIRRTVENYSLHPSAVEKIRTLQPRCFGSQEAPSGRPGDLLDPST